MKVFDAACGMSWAILPESLQMMLEIAAREHTFDQEAVEARLGHKLDNTHAVSNRDGVAVIPVSGPVFRYANLFTQISGATSIEALATDLTAALDDPAIHSIVLSIDSPGGEVNGTSEFADMVYAARDKKPVVAYVSHLGASAAYWIASAASHVVVSQTASVGSIGVVATMRDPGKSSAKDVEFVSSQSPRKRPNVATEKGRAQVQDHVDALADVFVNAVARNRSVGAETVLDNYGQGGLLVGAQAVSAGLADSVGSLEGVIARLQSDRQKKAGIRLVPAAVTEESVPVSSWKDFFAGAKDAGLFPEPAAAEASEVPAVTPQAAEPVKAEMSTEATATIEALRREVETLKAQRIAAEAVSFADTTIHAGQAVPAEREAIVTAYSTAATLAASGVAGSADVLEAIKASYAARPAHALTQETVGATGSDEQKAIYALPNPQETVAAEKKPVSSERKAQLLQYTVVGRETAKDLGLAK